MKRAPLLLSLVTALFMTVCAIEAATWPIKEPPDWEPEWWQILALAEIGVWISTPAIYISISINHLIEDHSILQWIGLLMPLAFTILAAAATIYWITKRLLKFIYGKSA